MILHISAGFVDKRSNLEWMERDKSFLHRDFLLCRSSPQWSFTVLMRLEDLFAQKNTSLVYVLVKLKTGSSLMLPRGSVRHGLINTIKHFACPAIKSNFPKLCHNYASRFINYLFFFSLVLKKKTNLTWNLTLSNCAVKCDSEGCGLRAVKQFCWAINRFFWIDFGWMCA